MKKHIQTTHNNLFLLFIVVSALSLFGCSNTLEVKGQFPRPVIDPIGLSLGVTYPEQFTQYNYQEENDERPDWDISIGNAQTNLFNQILPAMFTKLHLVSPTQQSDSPYIDLLMVPTLEEFQYNTPKETNVKMYEVWLKYNIKVYNQQHDLIADWIMTSYGKTPSAFMQSDQAALNEALVIALRDAGARLSLSFSHVPEIKHWLSQQQQTKLKAVAQPKTL